MSNPIVWIMSDEEYERVLLVKPTVYIYRIPPLISATRGFRAADWNLAEPDWTGRLRLITKGDKCFLKIEDSKTGQLYCQAPILDYPGPQVQAVVDSRRYFVVKVVSDAGRSALIGLGFADGADAFDLNVALQDLFVGRKNGAEMKSRDERPKLDLTLKGDIRMKLNISGLRQANDADTPRPKPSRTSNSNESFILPPPPSSKRK